MRLAASPVALCTSLFLLLAQAVNCFLSDLFSCRRKGKEPNLMATCWVCVGYGVRPGRPRRDVIAAVDKRLYAEGRNAGGSRRMRGDSRRIEELIESGRLDKAVEMFDKVRKERMPPQAFTRLLDLFGKRGGVEEAEHVYLSILESATFEPNAFILNTLMKVYARHSQMDGVMYCVQQMDELKIEKDVFTYSILLDAMGKAGLIDEIELIEEEMRRNCIEPNAVCYTTIMGAYMEAERFEIVLTKYREMNERFVQPNVLTYSIVLDAMKELRLKTEAEQLYENMIQQSITPNAFIYTTLMKLSHSVRDLHGVMRWYNAMLQRSISPPIVTINVLINAVGELGSASQAGLIYKRFRAKGFQPDAITISTIMKHFASDGDINKVREYFEEARSLCLQSPCPYNTLLKAMGGDASISEIEAVIHQMNCDGVDADLVTFNSLMKLYVQRQSIQDVRRVYRTIQARGLHADAFTYSTLVRAMLTGMATT